MKNNIKIDFTSRSFILLSNAFLIISGIVLVAYASWYLYNGIKDDSVRIDEILNLKNRVSIEVVDMKKLNSIQGQLDKHDLTNPSSGYTNPFIPNAKKEP